jgi:hypothetical protein
MARYTPRERADAERRREHVPHLPRTRASMQAAENAEAAGYDTREEREMDREP